MIENNFIVGRGQTKDLKLEDTITRAEFTRMVLVAKGEENLAKEDSTSKSDFKDVPNTHWAEKFIAYAKQKGYISGYPDGNFRPEGEITYEEMISILARIHPNYRKIEAKSTNWVEGFINFAKDNGILDDINIKGSYKSPAIREKTFEMIYNFIKYVENQNKSEKVSKAKEEKDVKKENSTWNGFYPYWLGYGFRPSVEEKPDVKPSPDVKPAPNKPDKPEKEDPGAEPEAPKEFDKTKIDKVEIVNKPSKLEYTEGEKLDLSGIKLKLTDTQGIVNEIGLEHFEEYGIITEPSVGASLTTNENGTTIKIKLHGEVKVETDLLIVNQKVFDPENLKTITVKTQPTKLIYTDGEKLNLTGLEVRLTDNQGLTKDVAFKDFAANGITAKPTNDTALTLTDNAKKVKLTKGSLTAETDALTVKAKVFDPAHVEKMVVKTQPTKLNYTEGEKLNLAGLEITLTDNQGLTKDVAFKDFAANGITAAPANATELKLADNGSKVKLTRGNLTAETEALTVKAKVFDPEHVEKMVVKTQPTKLNYTEGEKLNLAGLEVTLTDNQGLTKDVAFADFAANGIEAAPANETALTLTDNAKKVKLTKGNLTAETEALTVKAKAKFIEVTDTVNPIPEGYERLTFDATAYGKIGSAQVKAFDVLKGTTYDDAELKAKIKEVVAIPTGSTKEFKGWKPEIPTGTEAVATKNYEAEYKSKEFNASKIEKVEVIAPPTKLTYVVGEKLNLDGLKVKLTDNQGVTNEIGLIKFYDYGITTKPENNKQLTESDNNTKIIIKRENKEIITENISLTLKVISKDDFEKENKIKTNIKNSLVEVYKNLGDLKLGVDNLQNKYYLLFTKDASEVNINKENLKVSILNTIKKKKIKSYTIGESTRDLTKSDDEILGFIREDILKIAGLEGTQDATDAQILEKLKETKPNTKIKLVVEDGNVNLEFDYEIIFLTQMAEEKLVDIENKFIKVMEETETAMPEPRAVKFSYEKTSYKAKLRFINIKDIVTNYTNRGYKTALTNFLTGEDLGKSKSLSSLKSIAINSKKSASSIDNWGMMERLELEDLLTYKYGSFIFKTRIFSNTLTDSNSDEGGHVDKMSEFDTSVEYFYVDETTETGGVITRWINFEEL